ncbi:MAG: hypothetical protein LBC86_09930 [Oscillospiraceae bacterium]|jgi:hypothetical protein|nr:hypothetical protein [Oscillospiraceae bacterium]
MKIILFLIVVLLFSACAEQTAPLDFEYEEEAIEEIVDEIPEEIGESEEEISEPEEEITYFITHDDGTIEINLTKLFGAASDIHLESLDDRYVVVLQQSSFSVLDMEEQSIVYSEQFPGNMHGWIHKFGDDGVYIYSAVQVTPTPNYTEEYYITYIFPDNSWSEFLGEERTRTIIGNRILRHIDGGIYEDINGELIELLPPTPEESREYFGDEGEWRLSYDNIMAWHFYGFKEQIDDDRFLYNRGGYEWTNGFGVYDFATEQYTDMPNTRNLYVMGVKDNIVFTQFSDLSPMRGLYATNIDTQETVYFLSDDDFPRENRGGLTEVDERYTAPVLESFVLSPDKRRIAVVDYDLNVYIICADTGALEQMIRVDALYKGDTAVNSIYVDFLGNGRIIVFDQKWHMHDQRAFIIPLEFS